MPFYTINEKILKKKNLPLFYVYEAKMRSARKNKLEKLKTARDLLTQKVAKRSLLRGGR